MAVDDPIVKRPKKVKKPKAASGFFGAARGTAQGQPLAPSTGIGTPSGAWTRGGTVGRATQAAIPALIQRMQTHGRFPGPGPGVPSGLINVGREALGEKPITKSAPPASMTQVLGELGVKKRAAGPNWDIDPITGKPWTALTAAELKEQPGLVQSYKASGAPATKLFGGKGKDRFTAKNPADLTDKEYDTLRKAAAKGNKLAQQILDKGRYKAVGFPTAAQDIKKLTQPLVNQVQSLGPMAYGLQVEQQNALNNLTFNNASAQVNDMLSAMGVSGMPSMPAPTPETQNYINQLQSIVNNAPTMSTPMNVGGVQIPSMDQALGTLGQAAKISQNITPNQALLNALLSREQNQIIWGTGAVPGAANAGQLPGYIQELLQQLGMSANQGAITGTTPTVPQAQLPQAVTSTANPSSTGG